ncbi:hypothetical protein NL676_038895 [Syzygium grande]|nr:hypothetical protein NL676_038895 [Syzygium grande]
MATLASFLSSSPSLPRLRHHHHQEVLRRHRLNRHRGVDSLSFAVPPVRISVVGPGKGRASIAASSSADGASADDPGPGMIVRPSIRLRNRFSLL